MSERPALQPILASLHDAVLDDTRWPACSALIDEACRVQGNSLTFASGKVQDNPEVYFAQCHFRGERDHALEREYFDTYYPRDERVPRLMRLPDRQAVPIVDLYTEEELKTSEVCNEFLVRARYRDGLNVRMDGPNGSRITWAPADPVNGEGWSFDRIAFIGELLPHLRQYVVVRQALADARALGASLTGLLDTSGLGVLHLDGHGRIVTANDRGRDILKRGDALYDRGGILRARLPADDAALQRALAHALPGRGETGASGSLTIGRPDHRPGLTVHINPVGDGEIDFRPWRVAALVLANDHRADGHRPGPDRGGSRPHPGREPGGGAAGRRPDRRPDRRRDRPFGKNRPLARAADLRQAQYLAAGGFGARGAVAGGGVVDSSGDAPGASPVLPARSSSARASPPGPHPCSAFRATTSPETSPAACSTPEDDAGWLQKISACPSKILGSQKSRSSNLRARDRQSGRLRDSCPPPSRSAV